MKIKFKLPLLMLFIALVPFAATIVKLSSTFLEDQRAYQADLQLVIGNEVRRRTQEFFNSYCEKARFWTGKKTDSITEYLRGEPGVFYIQGNIGGQIVFSHPEPLMIPILVPSKGWNLVTLGGQLFLQCHQQSQAITLGFEESVIESLFNLSHGISARLVDHSSTVLFEFEAKSDDRQQSGPGVRGGSKFHAPEALRKYIEHHAPNVLSTEYDSLDGVEYVGSFFDLNQDQSTFLVLSTPKNLIQSVIMSSLKDSAVLLAVIAGLTILIGLGFSRDLTGPVSKMMLEAKRIADGDLGERKDLPFDRKDELGDLTRSVSQMRLDLVKLHEKIRSSERLAAIGQLSATIVHEIKNPLGAILGQVQLAEMELRDLKASTNVIGNVESMDGQEKIDEIRKSLKIVQSEAARTNRTVNRLLALASGSPVELHPVILNQEVKHALEVLKPVIEAEGVILKESFPVSGENVLIKGHKDQLQEVFQNLIYNAIHALDGRNPKAIEVSVSREQMNHSDFGVLKVKDTGCGMTPETLSKIFEPFFTTKKENRKGTGLGLSVVAGVVKAHGGSLKVTSTLGIGSEFEIRLPVV